MATESPKDTGCEKGFKCARVFIGKSKDSREACQLLRKAGFVVNSVPVVGLLRPVAKVEERIYQGIGAIRAAAKENGAPE
jgi:hypothetical protein